MGAPSGRRAAVSLWKRRATKWTRWSRMWPSAGLAGSHEETERSPSCSSVGYIIVGVESWMCVCVCADDDESRSFLARSVPRLLFGDVDVVGGAIKNIDAVWRLRAPL